MIFPAEIIEQILLRCDGRTLIAAREVSQVFRRSVDYLVQVGGGVLRLLFIFNRLVDKTSNGA